jgi:hypothetical protein
MKPFLRSIGLALSCAIFVTSLAGAAVAATPAKGAGGTVRLASRITSKTGMRMARTHRRHRKHGTRTTRHGKSHRQMSKPAATRASAD